MSIRKRVSSGTAKGAPCNSSNAWTKVAPLRTDARSAATHAAAPMVGIRGDASRFSPSFRTVLPCPSDSSSQVPSPSAPPLSSAERSPKRTSTRCNRRNPAHSAFRFSHSQTAIDASHAAQYSQPHASRITHHALHRLMNPSQRWPARTVRPSQAASRRPCNRPSTASNLPTCAMRRLPAIRST